ncbi:hypothetical protein B0T25DRAFT_598172 [Lasiosphaeria hispida]|uniref:Uncharacterized protein n=1 Tax=Lasiosphaeria hispida TaxID=260671 RepID=A0AAJ0HWN2_9PEZI|nr:hypothetical protein B0T25DRAFT_598172 [Lasiosphaeria hispida]
MADQCTEHTAPDLCTERTAPDQCTERTAPDQGIERGLDHEQEALLLNRSHLTLLCDLAELCKTNSDTSFCYDPFCDESFTLTPDEFWDFQESNEAGDFPFKIGKCEYDGTTLYFKNMTIVHAGVGSTMSGEIQEQLGVLKHHPEVGTLVRQLRSRINDWPVHISDTSFRKPDFSFGKNGSLLPTLVGEVSYSRRFTREQLEAKYRAYLLESGGKIRTVICADLYYAGTGQEILKTAEDLYRTAISVWSIQDGIIRTVEGAGIDLYLSDLVDIDDELPLKFVRPHNGPGWAPAIHLSFAVIIQDLQELCKLDASRPPQVRKRRRSTHNRADEEPRELKRRNVAMETQIQEIVAERDRDMRVVDRDIRVVRRDAAKAREQLAKQEQKNAEQEQEIAELRRALALARSAL